MNLKKVFSSVTATIFAVVGVFCLISGIRQAMQFGNLGGAPFGAVFGFLLLPVLETAASFS